MIHASLAVCPDETGALRATRESSPQHPVEIKTAQNQFCVLRQAVSVSPGLMKLYWKLAGQNTGKENVFGLDPVWDKIFQEETLFQNNQISNLFSARSMSDTTVQNLLLELFLFLIFVHVYTTTCFM